MTTETTQALRVRIEAALDYSGNYANANPYLSKTGREHILGLCKLLRDALDALAATPAPAVGREAVPTMDLDAGAWEAIKQAACESKWIPPQYYANDWHADVCLFLREGAQAFAPPAEAREPVGVTDAMVERAATALCDFHREVGDGAELPMKVAKECAEDMLCAALAQPQATPRDAGDAVLRAANKLAAAAMTTGGTAGADPHLQAAIDVFIAARDAATPAPAVEREAVSPGSACQYRHKSLPNGEGDWVWLPWQQFGSDMEIRHPATPPAEAREPVGDALRHAINEIHEAGSITELWDKGKAAKKAHPRDTPRDSGDAWQPAETAPTDGTIITARFDNHPVRPAMFDGGSWVVWGCVTESAPEPREWRPLA